MGIRTLLQTSRLTLSQASNSSQWLTGFERILWKGPSQLAGSSTCQSRACSYQNFPVQNSYATWSVGGQDQYRPLPQARSSRISVSTFEMVSFKICNIKTIKRMKRVKRKACRHWVLADQWVTFKKKGRFGMKFRIRSYKTGDQDVLALCHWWIQATFFLQHSCLVAKQSRTFNPIWFLTSCTFLLTTEMLRSDNKIKSATF